ncbi:MAG TPA: Gfo/Idh/MocA family oxidoreductase [Burkholderiales bacterium]|nr:Gfo/Idh/MocA family oxidoreductase [Burkholderiales bacterium]
MTKTNGWGLIGTGRIATDRVLPGINSFAGNKLIGVVSRTQARADDFAKRFKAQHAYTHYDDLLRNPDVTVVAIHTPNSLHAEQAIAAARAGKHVFCDKPMATNVADAERIVRECERAGVTLGINFHNRQMPCFVETQRIVQSGEIGKVVMVQLEASAGVGAASVAATWRQDAALAGLGTTMNVGTHVYDILRFILGAEIVAVTAMFDSAPGVMESTSLATFKFANGTLAQVNVNQTTPNPHNDFVIYGSKGRITGRALTRSRAGGELQVSLNDGTSRSQEFAAINAHQACVVAFSQALLEGRAPAASGIDGLRSVQLTSAMGKSAWEGVHVRLAG